MKRRNFLKDISLASLSPLLLNGMPVRALAGQSRLQQLAANRDNDRVLVLIQLHGGNDGLNTLVPINQYDQYVNLRSNIALPDQGSRRYLTLDSSLPDDQQLGVHPDMKSFQRLYDNGRSAIVQSVAYDQVNGSHFRSRDVWFMGGDDNDNFGSGWAGRYLNTRYPGYPSEYPSADMPDPLAIEIGNRVSLAFHRADGVPAAIAMKDPQKFYDLVSRVGGPTPDADSNSYYDEEISYISGIEQKSNQYAQRLEEVFLRGNNQMSYPERYAGQAPAGKANNKLSLQLKTIARMLSGGSRTKIFLARLEGFDTHAQQVQPDDTTTGTHAALLHNLFAAVEAFQNDLKQLGLEDRVMTVTMSEFGRRAASNGSLGTDHGAAAPLFVFGKHVNPGVVGHNADLSDLDNGNLKHQYDYRQVLGTLLNDWMQADASAMSNTKLAAFAQPPLPLVRHTSAPAGDPAPAPAPAPAPSSPVEFIPGVFGVEKVTPNPASTYLDVIYYLRETAPLLIKLIDMNGNTVVQQQYNARGKGKHKNRLRLPGMKQGLYVLVWQTGDVKTTRQVRVEQ